MTAKEINLLTFLRSPKQFVIPIYQRTYRWTLKQCEQLWKDIVRAATEEDVAGHFVGSIVYVEKGLYQVATPPQLLVIDGQQRLTTVSLLLAAFGAALEREGGASDITQRRVYNYYLLNAEEDGEMRYKLLLTQGDKATLTHILDGEPPPEVHSRRIAENYAYFADRIARREVDLSTLHRGLAKLLIVDISLDREHDDPQLIFESLNSTGLELSQADLIRNYVLMGLVPKEQEDLYERHWFPMEKRFGRDDQSTRFDQFMRDYLTVKTGQIANIREVYAAFKAFARGEKKVSIDAVVSDVHAYSRLFARIAMGEESDPTLRDRVADLNTLKVDVAFPFLLEVYDDMTRGVINSATVAGILRTLESYVFRRSICGIPTNALNKTFLALAREIDKADYLNSFSAALLHKEGSQRFPDDEEFGREFAVKDIYHYRGVRYLLQKLLNFEQKERVVVDGLTIEHVMPQNSDLSPDWRDELGEDWKAVQARHLHTIGNLTLTGHNAEMGDRPFREKREMPKGFAESTIRLNRDLATLDRWGEAEIVDRSRRLAALACRVWPMPALPSEVKDRYRRPGRSTPDQVYTFDDYPHLRGAARPLFDLIRGRILALSPAVSEKITKGYVAYKLATNFVDIEPRKASIHLYLNMDFERVDDPTGLCEDVTGRGHAGNGDVKVKMNSADQIEVVMALVRQSFEAQSSPG